MHTKRASTAQSTFFAHHEEEFNLHIGYELVRDRRDDAFLVSGPVGLLKIKWGLPHQDPSSPLTFEMWFYSHISCNQVFVLRLKTRLIFIKF